MSPKLETAPIALFVYNRPDHLEQVLHALRKNDLASDSDLIVFSDGAKDNKAVNAVRAVRTLVRGIRGFRSLEMVERTTNFGLAASITEGVSVVCEKYDKVIVLEDDLVTSDCFLRYMNDGLKMFRDDHRIGSIHGYMCPILELPEFFLIKGGDCWGWATWKDRWQLYEKDGLVLLKKLWRLGLACEFDQTGGSNLVRMLVRQIRGQNNSWFIRWHASLFLNRLLTVQPGSSFVQHIGNDGSGTHFASSKHFDVPLRESYTGINLDAIAPDLTATKKIYHYHRASVGARYAVWQLVSMWQAYLQMLRLVGLIRSEP